jgi:hypothetical protein
MPPPSPVWALDRQKEKTVVFFDASFQMHAKIEGKAYESRLIPLRVKGAEVKKADKVPGSS